MAFYAVKSNEFFCFLMEQVGFPATETEVMKSLSLDFDFYHGQTKIRQKVENLLPFEFRIECRIGLFHGG
jgi:hypothetical protein